MQFAIELAQQRPLTVGHVTDGIQVLPDLVSPLLVTTTLLPQNLGEHLGRLLETTRGAMLRLRLRQQIEGDDEERVDGIVGARQRDWRGQ